MAKVQVSLLVRVMGVNVLKSLRRFRHFAISPFGHLAIWQLGDVAAAQFNFFSAILTYATRSESMM
jgi:hypothetical protein